MAKPYAPFSINQQAYIDRALSSWFNVAEGSKRAGKNIMNVWTFCRLLDDHPDDLHLIAGYTSGTAGALIYKSDGLGIERYFDGRCRPGKFEDKPCYYVHTNVGQKVVLRSGGRDIRSQDYIAGYTFGSAYITEANRCEPDFVKEVFSRTFSSRNRKVFHDINPRSEHHPYYEDVLNYHAKQQELDPNYGFNYGHFTMADNLSMTDEQIRTVIRSVPKGTVWYARDILGERRQAEGLVYQGWQTDKDGKPNVVPTVPRQYSRMIASCDYGTRNNMVVLLWGLLGNTWYCVKEYVYSGRKEMLQKNSEMYKRDIMQFLEGHKVERFIIDPSAADFRISISQGGKYAAHLADNDVMEGIRAVADGLYLGIIKINDCCKNLIAGLDRYVWDEKPDINGNERPKKEMDDEVDSVRYFVHTMKIVPHYKGGQDRIEKRKRRTG